MEIAKEERLRPDLIYLLERGLTGYHLLFDDELIAEALYGDEEQIKEDGEKYNDLLNDAVRKLISARSVGEARDLVENLPRPVARLFAYIYFQAIQRSLDKKSATLH